MGWTFGWAKYWKKGKIDRKAECDALFTQEEHESESLFEKGKMITYPKMEVVKSVMVGSTYYGAIKTTRNNESEIWCAVCLTKTDKGDFGYKDMDETMLPYKYDCPKSILDLLTPTTNESANEWRRLCYEKLEKKKTDINLSKLPIGSQIKFILTFDTQRNRKGSEIVLTKNRRSSKSTYWTQGYCYWTRPLMKSVQEKCKIEILQIGKGE